MSWLNILVQPSNGWQTKILVWILDKKRSKLSLWSLIIFSLPIFMCDQGDTQREFLKASGDDFHPG